MEIDHDNVIDTCPCCGSPFDNQKVPLCENHNKLDFLGPGFPLFYEFLIFCIICIFLLLCIQGIYGLATNPNGHACEYINLRKAPVRCNENGINLYSWFNKEERDEVQSGLNLCGAFCLLILLNIFKYRHKQVEMKLENNIVSPSDYTIQVSELPYNEMKHDNMFIHDKLQSFFENCIPNRKIKISKVNLAYFVENHVNLKNLKEDLIAKQSNLIRSIFHAEGKKGVPQLLLEERKNEVDKKMAEVQEKIEKFENEGETGASDKFCGVAYISTQTEEDQDALLKYWERSFFQTILFVIKSKLFKADQKTFQGKIISVKRAPEPTDVIWENLGYSSSYRFKALLKTNLGALITLIACCAAIFGINLAQVAISEKDPKDENLVQGFGIIAAIFVFLVNIFLEVIINILVK